MLPVSYVHIDFYLYHQSIYDLLVLIPDSLRVDKIEHVTAMTGSLMRFLIDDGSCWLRVNVEQKVITR